eukprot:432965_1
MGCCCGKNKETEEINFLDLESGVVDVTKDDGTLDSKILGYERSVVESFLAGVVALLVIAALVIFVMYQYGYIYSANTSQNVEIGVEEASSSNTTSADAVLSQSSMLSGEQKNLIDPSAYWQKQVDNTLAKLGLVRDEETFEKVIREVHDLRDKLVEANRKTGIDIDMWIETLTTEEQKTRQAVKFYLARNVLMSSRQ